VAAAALLATVVSGVPFTPAADAVVKPGLSIKPGQKIVVKAPSPVFPAGKFDFFGGIHPSDCKLPAAQLGSSEFCDMYPVTIDASDELILSKNLQLNVTLEWAPGVTIQNCAADGNCGTNEMGVAIYTDPPQQGGTPPADQATASSGASGNFYGSPDTPLTIAHNGAGICGKRFDTKFKLPANNVCRLEYVDVGNFSGNNPYTLTLELVDFSGSGPIDRSIEDSFDLSGEAAPPAVASTAPTSSGPSTFTTFLGVGVGADTTPIGAGAPRVDLPGLGSSAGFDGIGPASLPSSDLAQKIVNRGPKVLGVAGPANGLALLLWLVLLPTTGITSFLFFLWRRRREDRDVSGAPA